MTKNIESMAGDERSEAGKSGAVMDCMDCIFWYRCKLGGIDCELKER